MCKQREERLLKRKRNLRRCEVSTARSHPRLPVPRNGGRIGSRIGRTGLGALYAWRLERWRIVTVCVDHQAKRTVLRFIGTIVSCGIGLATPLYQFLWVKIGKRVVLLLMWFQEKARRPMGLQFSWLEISET